jgi:hypothetical protein
VPAIGGPEALLLQSELGPMDVGVTGAAGMIEWIESGGHGHPFAPTPS